MGKVIPMLGGGGGADLDVITATAADVRAGKVIVDKEGNSLTGTEPERGNWTGSVAMNGKITIPDGHHGGSGYVNGPVVTQRGAWNGAVGMNTQVAIPEGYHNGAGKVTGPSVAYQNADVAGTDRANATNRSCWDGTICLGVRNNHYLNGVNWIQYSDPNFKASNFKKGVPIMGLTGTFEGYVPTPSDLYLRGNNPANFKAGNGNKIRFESGQISIPYDTGWQWITSQKLYNLAGYSQIMIEGSFYTSAPYGSYIELCAGDSPTIGGVSTPYMAKIAISENQTITNPVFRFNYAATKYICLNFEPKIEGTIYRIWLT